MVLIEPSQGGLSLSTPSYNPLTLTTHQNYQMHLLGQASLIDVILNLAAPYMPLNPYGASQKYQKRIFYSQPSRPIHFNLSYFILIYFILMYLTLNLITVIYSVLGLPLSNLSYLDLFKSWVPFTHRIFIEITNHVNGYHLLTLLIHIYISEGVEAQPIILQYA